MNDYMKEAERLSDDQIKTLLNEIEYGNMVTFDDYAYLIARKIEWHARSALLAHIQRGVPEGNERDEWEAVVFTLMGHAASLYFLGQSDMPNWFYELAEKLARRHVDEALAARVREVGIQQRAALAPAPDHFRDAAEMVAEPEDNGFDLLHDRPHTEMPGCRGVKSMKVPAPAEVPMPKPVAYGFGNTAITGHTNRLMMVRIDVPLDDQYAGAFWLPLVLADEAHTYGVACRAAGEAAGYARGLADAGRDAERYRIALQLIEHATAPTPDDGAYHENAHELAKHALRGEVKP